MKKLVRIIFAISVILCFSACSSSKVPTDEEIKNAYQQAVEAYSWFDLTTMPLDAGDQLHEIIRESDRKIIYKVSVDILDDDLEKVVDKEVSSFAYEFSKDKWIFTNFSLVW